MWWISLIIIPAVLFGIYMLLSFFGRAKCPKCKSRSRELIESELVDQTAISIKKEIEDKIYDYESYSKGMQKPEKIIKKTVYVPGTKYTYHNTYKCKKCGNEYTVEEYEEKED